MTIPGLNGGLLVLVLAAIWLVIFTPALKNRSEYKEQHRAEKSARQQAKASQFERLNSVSGARAASRFSRYSLGRRATGWSSIITLTIGVVSLFQVGSSESAGVVATISLATTGLLFVTNLLITRAQQRLLVQRRGVRRSVPSLRVNELLTSAAQAQEQLESEEQAVVAARNWNATRVPTQLYRSEIGTLETPVMADVVSLENKIDRATNESERNSSENSDTTRKNIDEILRRRRANGS